MKKRKSPCTPYREKAKGKETSPGFFETCLSPRARARSGELYRRAGEAAREIVDVLGAEPTADNLNLWSWYCYRHDPGIIIDKAYECASRMRQGEIKNAVTAFQHWLSKSYAEGVAE